MSKKLLKIISVALLVYPLAASIWQVLPEDVTTLIPNYTELIALVSGSASGILGAGGLLVTSYVDSSKKDSYDIFDGLYKAYTLLAEKTDNSVKTTNDNTQEIAQLKNDFVTIKTNQEELIALEKANLELKLSNPLIDEKTKEIYEKMLGD